MRFGLDRLHAGVVARSFHEGLGDGLFGLSASGRTALQG